MNFRKSLSIHSTFNVFAHFLAIFIMVLSGCGQVSQNLASTKPQPEIKLSTSLGEYFYNGQTAELFFKPDKGDQFQLISMCKSKRLQDVQLVEILNSRDSPSVLFLCENIETGSQPVVKYFPNNLVQSSLAIELFNGEKLISTSHSGRIGVRTKDRSTKVGAKSFVLTNYVLDPRVKSPDYFEVFISDGTQIERFTLIEDEVMYLIPISNQGLSSKNYFWLWKETEVRLAGIDSNCLTDSGLNCFEVLQQFQFSDFGSRPLFEESIATQNPSFIVLPAIDSRGAGKILKLEAENSYSVIESVGKFHCEGRVKSEIKFSEAGNSAHPKTTKALKILCIDRASGQERSLFEF